MIKPDSIIILITQLHDNSNSYTFKKKIQHKQLH